MAKKMLRRLSTAQIRQVIAWHKKTKTPYTAIFTNQRIVFKSKHTYAQNKESEFPPEELSFIQRVKKTIIDEKLYQQVPNKFRTAKSLSKIKYFQYNTSFKPGTVLTDCYEIDMKSAYWETAYRLGILKKSIYQEATPLTWDQCLELNLITKTTYTKCKNLTPSSAYQKGLITKPIYKRLKGISKSSRLAAIGTLAKTETTILFDGKKQIQSPPKRSKQTEHLWHTISYTVGEIMNEIAEKCGKNFVFFWVDAMFVKDEQTLNKVMRLFKKHGYGFESFPCREIEFSTDKIIVWGKGKWVQIDGKKVWREDRPFPYAGPEFINKVR